MGRDSCVSEASGCHRRLFLQQKAHVWKENAGICRILVSIGSAVFQEADEMVR